MSAGGETSNILLVVGGDGKLAIGLSDCSHSTNTEAHTKNEFMPVVATAIKVRGTNLIA